MLSPEAIKNDHDMGLKLYPPKRIYLDHDFNAREAFSPMDCTELARDIQRRGLLQPVTIRPVRTTDQGELKAEHHLIGKYDYVCIAGHRRIMGYVINEAEGIPAVLKPMFISNFDAKDINAVENLQRKDLNLTEEAESIRHYWMVGWGREEIAQRINKSPGWVQTRLLLLTMPKEVQQLAGQGYILGKDLMELNKYKDKVELLRAAAVLRDARKKGMKNADHIIKKKDKASTKKIRGAKEIQDMQEYLREIFKDPPADDMVRIGDLFSPQGNCIATRVLAWAAGVITSGELHISIRECCEVLGIPYIMPKMEPEYA